MNQKKYHRVIFYICSNFITNQMILLCCLIPSIVVYFSLIQIFLSSQIAHNDPRHPLQVVTVVPDDDPLLILVTNVVVWIGKVGSLSEYRLDLCLFLIDFYSNAFQMCSMYLSTMIDLHIQNTFIIKIEY